MNSIPVQCPGGVYEVVIAAGAIDSLGSRVAEAGDWNRCLLVQDAAVRETHGANAARSLAGAGFEVIEHVLVASESNKTISTVESIYQSALGGGLDRHGVVVAVGGGLTGDVAGFAAASYLRGIGLVQVPTSLLAMVDASVGGKTGVNLHLPPDDTGVDRLGKNLAGAFWQPALVLVDPCVLETLPMRERRCGLSECVKHGIIGDPDLLQQIGAHLDSILDAQADAVSGLVDRAVRVKVSIVEEDEREHGRRALLNLGHTFAHAIEPIPELDLLHGEAVAIGLVASIRLSERLGRLKGDWSSELVGLLERIGLPVGLPSPVPTDELIHRMQFDKKARGGVHRLVIPEQPGCVEVVDAVQEDAIRAAWMDVGAV